LFLKVARASGDEVDPRLPRVRANEQAATFSDPEVNRERKCRELKDPASQAPG
jgi:hypothetical protein